MALAVAGQTIYYPASKGMQLEKVKAQWSIEARLFMVLQEIEVELSPYHGGSLNDKDIKR